VNIKSICDALPSDVDDICTIVRTICAASARKPFLDKRSHKLLDEDNLCANNKRAHIDELAKCLGLNWLNRKVWDWIGINTVDLRLF